MARKSRLEICIAATDPRPCSSPRNRRRLHLQLADPDIAAWTIRAVKGLASLGGTRPHAVKICVAAPPTSAPISSMQRSVRWFVGHGQHVADIVARYGNDAAVPTALTDYIKGRQGYDYNEHGRAGNTHASFVPDDIVDRFCILGPVSEHSRRLEELRAMGVDQFAVYLQHDSNDATLGASAITWSPRRRAFPANRKGAVTGRGGHRALRRRVMFVVGARVGARCGSLQIVGGARGLLVGARIRPAQRIPRCRVWDMLARSTARVRVALEQLGPR